MSTRKAIKSQKTKLTPAADTTPVEVKVDDSARLREIRALVEANNQSSIGTDILICQIYMESRFDAHAGANHDARGLMQMQRQATQQVFKYRKQKELGRMPSDAQTRVAFNAAAALHGSAAIFDEATNIRLGSEYMQYWVDTSPSIVAAYARYRGVANGIYYRKISACAERLQADPNSMQLLRDMVK